MTKEQYEAEKKKIDEMNRLEMAYLMRFAPPGHPYFDPRLDLNAYFLNRFKELGGWDSELSKAIGWR